MEQFISYRERSAINRRRRVEQIKKRIILSLIIVLFFLSTIFFMTQKAFAGEKVVRKKTCTSIEIQQGDTLWEIAKTYYTDECVDLRTYIDSIKKANNMHDDKLICGQSLLVPYYKMVETNHSN